DHVAVVADVGLEPSNVPGGEDRNPKADGSGKGGGSPNPPTQRRVGVSHLLLLLTGVVRHDLPKLVGQADDRVAPRNDFVVKAIFRGDAVLGIRRREPYGSVPVVANLAFETPPGSTVASGLDGVVLL